MGAEAAAAVGGGASSIEKKKSKKKRTASHLDDRTISGCNEAVDGVLVEDDLLEPTMGEKLASLDLQDGTAELGEAQELVPLGKLPSADSVNILLKQALHADDRSLLLDCLYTQDEKVIANSVSSLSMSDVLKLLHSLVTIIEARGAIVACALPWLRNLLLLHASGIMSQESSFRSLNSLNQLIDSRVSTFESALQLSSCIDLLCPGIVDDAQGEDETITPVIFEDNDGSDDEQESESDDGMEMDKEIEGFHGLTDSEEGSEGLMED
ncbi:U3 small nucleolar RNA-associated protein 5 [Linum perenne]